MISLWITFIIRPVCALTVWWDLLLEESECFCGINCTYWHIFLRAMRCFGFPIILIAGFLELMHVHICRQFWHAVAHSAPCCLKPCCVCGVSFLCFQHGWLRPLLYPGPSFCRSPTLWGRSRTSTWLSASAPDASFPGSCAPLNLQHFPPSSLGVFTLLPSSAAFGLSLVTSWLLSFLFKCSPSPASLWATSSVASSYSCRSWDFQRPVSLCPLARGSNGLWESALQNVGTSFAFPCEVSWYSNEEDSL